METHTIAIANMKCGGCAKSITRALEKAGLEDVLVDLTAGTVQVRGSRKKAVQVLLDLGYPEKGTPDEKRLLKKLRSYASCALGKYLR